MSTPRVIEYIQVRNGISVIYPSFEQFPSREKKEKERKAPEKHDKFKGVMSSRTRAKVKKIVENWDNAINAELSRKKLSRSYKWKYLTFVTLTLTSRQVHTDNEIKRKCLNRFLIEAGRKWNIENYLWVAEPQNNGNIHFHILVDGYIHHRDLRFTWNKCLEVLGYIDRFEEKHGHRHPNSTDIHSLRGVNNVGSYVAKYLTKDEEKRKITGRLWSCSKRLGEIKAYSNIVDSEISSIIVQAEKEGLVEVEYQDYCVVVLGPLSRLLRNNSRFHRTEWQKHHLENYNYIYKGIDFPEIMPLVEEYRKTSSREPIKPTRKRDSKKHTQTTLGF